MSSHRYFRTTIALAAAALSPITAAGQPGRVRIVRTEVDSLQPDTSSRRSRPKADVGTFDGLVTDTSLAPLGGAVITVLRTSLKVRTSSDGRFRITRMPTGQYLIIVRFLGFHPASAIVEVSGNDTIRASFALTRVPYGLDTVRVVTERRSFRMMEFEYRRKIGEGQFLAQDQIDKHNSTAVSDLIRFAFHGVAIISGGGLGQQREFLVGTRGAGGVTTLGNPSDQKSAVIVPVGCILQVIVDDVVMPRPFDLSLLPSPREIAGIELYTGSAVLPVRYNSLDASCGLMLIWTKDGS